MTEQQVFETVRNLTMTFEEFQVWVSEIRDEFYSDGYDAGYDNAVC